MVEHEDGSLVLEAHHLLPSFHPMKTTATEDWDAKANGDQLQVKRAKVDNANYATGVGEEDEISLEEQVLSNHVLLEEIFKHSTFQDLKSHRKLNQLWNLEATKVILNRVSMRPIKLSSTDTRLNVNCTNIWRLDKFQLLVEQSKIFPCNTFLIEEPDLLKDTLLNFFTTHGSLIKSIVYEVGPNQIHFETDVLEGLKLSGYPTSAKLIQLLADHLPNLEVLTLRTCPSSRLQIEPSFREETANSKKELKRLHTVHISGIASEVMLRLLLKRSTNLKHIYDSGERNLLMLVKLNAIHMLYEICFTFDEHSISFYEQVVTSQLNCKEIEVDWGGFWLSQADLPKVGRILTKAIHSSRGILRRLSLRIPLGHVPELRFATCPKVTRIETNYGNPSYLPTNLLAPLLPPFPLNFNLEATFPNLRELEFCVGYFGDSPLFPEFSLPLLFVRNLTICRPDEADIPTRWLKQLCQLFPNITNASLSNISDSAFGLISTFRYLEKLEITIVIEKTNEDFGRVDSLLTGFSREIVRRIYHQSEADFNANLEDLEGLRVTGSVADLKNLTELVINISLPMFGNVNGCSAKREEFVVRSGLDAENPVLKMDKNVTISHVSRKFCFDMCPKLRSNVIIKFEDSSYLMPQDDD